jgi:hypothetical protein
MRRLEHVAAARLRRHPHALERRLRRRRGLAVPDPPASREPAEHEDGRHRGAGRPGRRDGFAVAATPSVCVEELALADSASYSSAISRSSIARSLIDCTRWSGLLPGSA